MENNKGIDRDLESCLEYNPQEFNISNIEKVLAVVEGERDGDSWHWIIKLTKDYIKNNPDKKFVYLSGWCDYTGWDCQSGATSIFGKNIKFVLKEIKKIEIQTVLIQQIKTAKERTWREKKDIEFAKYSKMEK